MKIFGLLLVLIAGLAGGYWLATHPAALSRVQVLLPWLPEMPRQEMTAGKPGERKPLFYRNPMNPSVTSPVPAKDAMGMDYVPVYADEKKPSKQERKPLFYRNPMNPSITSPVPAKDAMGMDYVPVYADEATGGESEPAGTVKIDPVMMQNIGVRTTLAERRPLSHEIRTVGRVAYNEEHLARLHPKTEGWIEKQFIDKTGESVKRGTILLSIYSPQLVATEQEYLLALSNLEILRASPYPDIRRGAEELVHTSRERLKLLDVPEHQIRELEQTRKIKKNLHIHSPFNGTVIKIGAREGQYVTPTTELYEIADLHRIWVYADIYEYELPWVRTGDEAELTLTALPGRIFKGRLAYVYPYAEAKTRTVKVRMTVDNPDLELKPEMFADVVIHSRRQADALAVPEEAVVRSGDRNLVFVAKEGGKFEPVAVKLGLSGNGYVQILAGLKEGDKVVTSSQFLIDSESKLREATAKMLENLKPDNRRDAEGAEMERGKGKNQDGMSHEQPRR